MKFELKFDIETYDKQMNILFDLAWNQRAKYYKNSNYFGFVLLLIGFNLIFNHFNLFAVSLLIFGLGILIPYYYYYFKIKINYKKFEDTKTKEIEIVKNNISIWEFKDEGLKIQTGTESREIEWNKFIIYLVKEDNLLAITEDYEPFILGEIEVGKLNFKKIVEFVSQKIKYETTGNSGLHKWRNM
ncbi:MAG: hypothetical protein ACOH1O_14420 [Flavobacterium sp.]